MSGASQPGKTAAGRGAARSKDGTVGAVTAVPEHLRGSNVHQWLGLEEPKLHWQLGEEAAYLLQIKSDQCRQHFLNFVML